MEDRKKLEKALISLDDYKGRYFCLKRDQRIAARRAAEFSATFSALVVKKIAEAEGSKNVERGLLELFELAITFADPIAKGENAPGDSIVEIADSAKKENQVFSLEGREVPKLCEDCARKMEEFSNPRGESGRVGGGQFGIRSISSVEALPIPAGSLAGSSNFSKLQAAIAARISEPPTHSGEIKTEPSVLSKLMFAKQTSSGSLKENKASFLKDDGHLRTILCSEEEVKASSPCANVQDPFANSSPSNRGSPPPAPSIGLPPLLLCSIENSRKIVPGKDLERFVSFSNIGSPSSGEAQRAPARKSADFLANIENIAIQEVSESAPASHHSTLSKLPDQIDFLPPPRVSVSNKPTPPTTQFEIPVPSKRSLSNSDTRNSQVQLPSVRNTPSPIKTRPPLHAPKHPPNHLTPQAINLKDRTSSNTQHQKVPISFEPTVHPLSFSNVIRKGATPYASSRSERPSSKKAPVESQPLSSRRSPKLAKENAIRSSLAEPKHLRPSLENRATPTKGNLSSKYSHR